MQTLMMLQFVVQGYISSMVFTLSSNALWKTMLHKERFLEFCKLSELPTVKIDIKF